MKKVNVVTVEYLNTKPFLEGLRRSTISDLIDIEIAHPAKCAEKIISAQGEIGLIPVGALPFLDDYEIISDFCLGCDGAVSSVCIFSEIPLNKCDTIILDYQSRSSVVLTKYLHEKYWLYDLKFVQGKPGYEKKIQDRTAGLVIGDRCFNLKEIFPYHLDLGEAWKKYTELPFVFAVWVSRFL